MTASLPFINPATGQTYGAVTATDPARLPALMAELRTAAKPWGQRTPAERVRVLREFQRVLINARDDISLAIHRSCGKSRQDGLIELFASVDMLNTYNNHAPAWLKRRQVSRGLYLFKECFVEPRPYGVVTVIAPWNYPFALSVPPMVAALLAGNAVMLKISEVTPAIGVLVEDLVNRVPELREVVRVVHGDGRVGAAMIQARPDYIFFTGSTPTGRKILQTAAEHLIPSTMELGGKDAMLVLDDADVEAAAQWGAWGAFYNAGQTCMSIERVYVVEAVYPRFLEAVIRHTQAMQIGASEDVNSPFHIGPLTDPRQVTIVRAHLEDALARGAQVAHGGRFNGQYMEPTILTQVDHSMVVMQEETFGPLMPIMAVKDEAEAIRLANDSPFGLSASVWSNDLARARRVADQLQAGSVIINDSICHFAVPMLPFGGQKASGFGRTHGKEGLLQFTQANAYMVGGPPVAWDVATILRQPGHYQEASDLLRAAFAPDLDQRLEPVRERLAPVPLKKAALGLALAGAALALAFVLFNPKKS